MLLERIAELCKNFRWNRKVCPNCAGFYAPSNHACDGCDHGSMFRPVDPETYKNFTYGE